MRRPALPRLFSAPAPRGGLAVLANAALPAVLAAISAYSVSSVAVRGCVLVTVNQTLTTIQVTPGSASVSSGGTQQFTATAKDQFGAALASQPAFTWTVASGSTVSGVGLFTKGRSRCRPRPEG